MIEPVLPAACYTQDHWFALEQREIFGKLWLFAGLTQQLKSENSFITRQFGSTSVLIQNTGSKIRAFKNACAHRGMPIQTAECGKRKLICPYHGWSYGENGELRGIPNAQIYNFCESDKNLGLHQFPLETVGSFVFINLSNSPIPIEQQYSTDLLTVLREISFFFAEELSYTHFPCNYNWKLNFENILDWNHFQFVHKQTLATLLEVDERGTLSRPETSNSLLFGEDAPLSRIKFYEGKIHNDSPTLIDLSNISRVSMPHRERWFSGLFESACDLGAFFNCKLFPNMNFGSIHGENFYLQQYVPVAPDRIEYHSWVFTSRLKPHVPSQPHLLWGIHHAEKRVIDEDTVLLTALQTSLGSLESVGPMGDHEAPLVAMGQWYVEHLKNGREFEASSAGCRPR